MSARTDHSKLPRDVLATNLNRLLAKLDDLEMEEDSVANQEKIVKIQKKIDEYTHEIEKRSKAAEPKTEPGVATTVAPANPLGTSEAKFTYNSMISHFKSNIPTLEPPLDVSIFIQKLQNCFNLYVKELPILEPYFVKTAKGYVSMDILENINASEDPTGTFEELQTFLKKHYGSRETPFQLLNSLMEMQMKEGEKLQEFAGRLERKIATVVTQIAAKFKDLESNSDGSPMNMSECFNLFGAMLFYDHLRKTRPNCFNLMVKDVDTCWKPSDLGSMAATLVDRMDITESHQAANQSFSARPNPMQQKHQQKSNKSAPNQSATSKGATFPKDVCYRFLTKVCNKPNCVRKHLSKGDNGYDHVLQLIHNGVAPPGFKKFKPKSTSNTHVAKPSLEFKPEEVGLGIFENYNPSKN